MATLDELTGGRTEIVVSTGNFGLLAQYNIDWEGRKPLSRLKEAMHVMRTFLDEGAITFEGDFFKYSGLYTFARPVQDRIPIKMGAMKGPRSFQTAGELADGMHQALAYSREAYDYSSENLKIGAEKAGRDWTELDNGAWVVTVVSEDSAAAKQAARILVAFYISSMPQGAARAPRDRGLRARAGGRGARRGRRQEGRRPVRAALRREARASPGRPRRSSEKIKADLVPAGVNHMIFSLADPALVKLFSGEDVPERPGHQRPAQADRRAGDAGLRVR